MATTYNGVTLVPLAEDRMWRPQWEQAQAWTARLIPYANKDDVQFAGRGNRRLTLQVLVENDSGIATLLAATGTTGRTLANLYSSGDNYTNTRLLEVKDIRRWDFGAKWVATLIFDREGS